MNDASITVIGFVAAEPRFEILPSGTAVMSLRIGSTPRRFDPDLGRWRDDESMFLTVSCWRSLAANLQECDLKRGDPVVVTGRLRIREIVRDGQRLLSAQVEATTVGHDLSRGVARLQRSRRTAGDRHEERRRADHLADRWIAADDPGEVPAGPAAREGAFSADGAAGHTASLAGEGDDAREEGFETRVGESETGDGGLDGRDGGFGSGDGAFADRAGEPADRDDGAADTDEVAEPGAFRAVA